MIYTLTKKRTDPFSLYYEDIYQGDKTEYIPFRTDNTINFKSDNSFIAIDISKKTNEKADKLQQGVFCLNGENGHIFYSGDEGADYLNGMYFWTFETVNKIYTVYEVCLGRKGIYLCLYNGDELIAQISKDTKARGNCNQYDIYSKTSDKELFSYACIFWDTFNFPEDSIFDFGKMNTWNREIREKYDPNFIKNVKSNFYKA